MVQISKYSSKKFCRLFNRNYLSYLNLCCCNNPIVYEIGKYKIDEQGIIHCSFLDDAIKASKNTFKIIDGNWFLLDLKIKYCPNNQVYLEEVQSPIKGHKYQLYASLNSDKSDDESDDNKFLELKKHIVKMNFEPIKQTYYEKHNQSLGDINGDGIRDYVTIENIYCCENENDKCKAKINFTFSTGHKFTYNEKDREGKIWRYHRDCKLLNVGDLNKDGFSEFLLQLGGCHGSRSETSIVQLLNNNFRKHITCSEFGVTSHSEARKFIYLDPTFNDNKHWIFKAYCMKEVDSEDYPCPNGVKLIPFFVP